MMHSDLTPVRFKDGLWQGHLRRASEPKLAVLYQGEPLDDVRVTKAQDGWDIQFTVPQSALSDGVHCCVITDADSAEKLGDVTIISGSPAADDLRAEVELLRAELDMLKRAFRRVQNSSASG